METVETQQSAADMAVARRAAYMTVYPPPRESAIPAGWHICHLILTLMTFGCWSVVWITHSILFEVSVRVPQRKMIAAYWAHINYYFPV